MTIMKTFILGYPRLLIQINSTCWKTPCSCRAWWMLPISLPSRPFLTSGPLLSVQWLGITRWGLSRIYRKFWAALCTACTWNLRTRAIGIRIIVDVCLNKLEPAELKKVQQTQLPCSHVVTLPIHRRTIQRSNVHINWILHVQLMMTGVATYHEIKVGPWIIIVSPCFPA